MPWQSHVLVLASQTADSDELLAALQGRADRGACGFTLICPRVTSRAEERLERAVGRIRDAGLRVEGRLGDPDPMLALTEAWDPREYDEIVVCTLPTGTSRWLQVDLPHRIERHTGVPVTHVIAAEPRPEVPVEHLEPHEKPGVLAPLRPLAWGRARH
jgi:GABA permease